MKIHYIEAPTRGWGQVPRPIIFMAGGITDCPDWQREALIKFQDYDLEMTLLNPRRAKFPMDNPDAALEQIKWEYDAMRDADAIMFWFAKGSLNPIALFEFGTNSQRHLQGEVELFIGTDKEYMRQADILIQTKLALPHHEVALDLGELVSQVASWVAFAKQA